MALCTEPPVSLPNVFGLICSLNCDIVKTVTKIFPSTILTAILTPYAETHTRRIMEFVVFAREQNAVEHPADVQTAWLFALTHSN